MSSQEPLDSGRTSHARILEEQLYLLYVIAAGAYYNRANCLNLTARTVAVALGGHGRPEGDSAFHADFLESLAEMQDFASTFSKRCVSITIPNF